MQVVIKMNVLNVHRHRRRGYISHLIMTTLFNFVGGNVFLGSIIVVY